MGRYPQTPLIAIPTVAVISFVVSRSSPSHPPTHSSFGADPRVPPEVRQHQTALGLDDPWPIRYVGDEPRLGNSASRS